MAELRILVTILVLLIVCPGLTWGQARLGQWHGSMPKSAPAESPSAQERVSRFLVRDTGGSGGMFGHGDLRQKLLDVAFWKDGRHGAACGAAGAFYTDDGGLTWKRIRQHPRNEYPDEKGVLYYAVELSGPREIWLTEGKHPHQARHLWHSTDAGRTWEDAASRFPSELETDWDLLARGQHVWLLGGWAPKASYRSDDGGKTWLRLELPEGFEPFTAVTPASEPIDKLQTVYLLGAVTLDGNRLPQLLSSDDAGKTWRDMALPEPQELPLVFHRCAIAFATPETGMLGLDAKGYRTTGFGRWEKPPGTSASVLVTEDGGKTWARRYLPNEELTITALWLDPSDPQHALAGVWNGFVGQNGGPRRGPALCETLDGGEHWNIAVRGGVEFSAIAGLDSRRVWAVGDLIGFGSNDVVAILTEPAKAGSE